MIPCFRDIGDQNAIRDYWTFVSALRLSADSTVSDKIDCRRARRVKIEPSKEVAAIAAIESRTDTSAIAVLTDGAGGRGYLDDLEQASRFQKVVGIETLGESGINR